jgi:hypothetical protein
MGIFVSHPRRIMTLVTLLLTVAAAAPARADAPFSIVFGLDQQRRPAFSIKAFGGPRSGQKLFSIDSIDTSGLRTSPYTAARAEPRRSRELEAIACGRAARRNAVDPALPAPASLRPD